MLYASRSLMVFPVLLLASFYATWAAGRLALGRWPRPSWDDPKRIEGAFMWTYHVTGILLVPGVPLFCVAMLVLAWACLTKKPEGWQTRLRETLAALIVFVAVLAFIGWDPHSVVNWYFD